MWISILIYLIFLFALYTISRTSGQTTTWDFIQSHETFECVTDDDCSSSQMCHDFQCVETLRGRDCRRSTGYWVLDQQSKKFKCVCRYPHLVTQSEPGSDCTLDVACGVYGRLENIDVDPLLYGKCLCERGLSHMMISDGPVCTMLTDEKLGPCHPFPALSDTRCDCPPDYIDSNDPEAATLFHADYLKQFREVPKCLRQPCFFDAVTGKPLKHNHRARHSGQVFCFCDAHYGNYGVRLETKGPYLLQNDSSMYYNACTNIHGKEEHNDDFKLFVHFYVNDKLPISFIRFGLGRDEYMNVSDAWESGYYMDITTRQIPEKPAEKTILVAGKLCSSFPSIHCDDRIGKESYFGLQDCRAIVPYIPTFLDSITPGYVATDFQNAMSGNTVCIYQGDEPTYKDKIVMNPYWLDAPSDAITYSHSLEITPYHVKMPSKGMDVVDTQWRFEPLEAERYFSFADGSRKYMDGKTWFENSLSVFS